MHRFLALMWLGAASLLAGVTAANAADPALEKSIAQLRDAIGEWDVVTEFLHADGSIARRVTGTYRFSWVIEDHLVSGTSDMPELEMTSAILFYIDQREREIEMVSVGRDGRLWVMSGPLDGETRYTEEFEPADGGTAQLRFTRYNVTANRFESRMDYTNDGGATWLPGNHQVFQRRVTDSL